MSKDYEITDLDKLDHLYFKLKTFLTKTYISTNKFKGLLITVSELDKHSDPQRRRYWSMIRQLKETAAQNGTFLNDDDWHVFIKIKSGFSKVVEVNGETQLIPKSVARTKSASKDDLNFLMNYISQLSLEYYNTHIE